MKVSQFTYTCGACLHHFFAPGVSDFVYGHFVLKSEDGKEFAFLDAINDIIFNEISHLIESFSELKLKNDTQKAEIIQNVFTVTCDLSPHSKTFHIGTTPVCPKCKSRKMKAWEVCSPSVTVDIPEVTHHSWLKLSSKEKERTLRQYIKHRQL